MNKFESYIRGSIDKPKVDKTIKDWIRELIVSLFHVKKTWWIFLALYGGSFVFYYLPFWGFSVHPLVVVTQKALAFLLFPIFFLTALIFFIRILGVLGLIVMKDIKATNLKVSDNEVIISLVNGKQKVLDPKNITRIIVIYNFRGFLIRTRGGTKTYSIQFEPKDIEQQFDILNGFNKEISSFQSKEGDMRSVYYTNQAFINKI